MSNTSKQSTIIKSGTIKSDNILYFRNTRKNRIKEKELNYYDSYQKVEQKLSTLQKLELEKIFNQINADIQNF